MHVGDEHLAEVRTRGFTVVERCMEPDLLQSAQAVLWELFPRSEAYFADPAAYPRFAGSQFSGMEYFPYPSWALNRLAVHPDLVAAAERLCGTDDLQLYKAELWAK